MRRFLLTLTFAVAVGLCWSSPASADTRGSATTDDTGADADARTTTAQDGGGGSATDEDCTYTPISIPDGTLVYDIDGNVIPVDGTGQWYQKHCGATFRGAFYISPASPRDLLVEARRRINAPLPQPYLSPNGEQVVNLTTWMWMTPEDQAIQSATASVPGLSVTVSATPEAVYWNMGDGTIVTCTGPGTPFDPSRPAAFQRTDCSHRYQRSSINQPGQIFAASVTTRWRLSWTVVGAGGGGDLGTIDRTTPFSVPVAEVQTVNVNPRGER